MPGEHRDRTRDRVCWIVSNWRLGLALEVSFGYTEPTPRTTIRPSVHGDSGEGDKSGETICDSRTQEHLSGLRIKGILRGAIRRDEYKHLLCEPRMPQRFQHHLVLTESRDMRQDKSGQHRAISSSGENHCLEFTTGRFERTIHGSASRKARWPIGGRSRPGR